MVLYRILRTDTRVCFYFSFYRHVLSTQLATSPKGTFHFLVSLYTVYTYSIVAALRHVWPVCPSYYADSFVDVAFFIFNRVRFTPGDIGRGRFSEPANLPNMGAGGGVPLKRAPFSPQSRAPLTPLRARSTWQGEAASPLVLARSFLPRVQWAPCGPTPSLFRAVYLFNVGFYSRRERESERGKRRK